MAILAGTRLLRKSAREPRGSEGVERSEGRKLCPKKLEAGEPASGVEGFPEPTARWTLNRV